MHFWLDEMKWEDLFEREKENVDFAAIGRKKCFSDAQYFRVCWITWIFLLISQRTICQTFFTFLVNLLIRKFKTVTYFFDAFLTSSGCLLVWIVWGKILQKSVEHSWSTRTEFSHRLIEAKFLFYYGQLRLIP